MNIYEINKEILNLVNPETGEVDDFDALESLQMVRDEKIENIALWIKELKAEATAIRNEEKSLAERRRTAENKAERLKDYLQSALAGESFKSPKVAISYRTSKAVVIDDEDAFTAKYAGDEYLVNTVVQYVPDKTHIKLAIEKGEKIDGAHIQENQNLQIK